MINRAPITNAVIAAASTSGFAIGDGMKPLGSSTGWNGQPGVEGAEYVPYGVILSGSVGPGDGPMSDSQTEWHFNYSYSTFGATRQQAEEVSDGLRNALQTLVHQTLDGGDAEYTVQLVQILTMGAVSRVDSIDPPLFNVVETFALWLTKET